MSDKIQPVVSQFRNINLRNHIIQLSIKTLKFLKTTKNQLRVKKNETLKAHFLFISLGSGPVGENVLHTLTKAHTHICKTISAPALESHAVDMDGEKPVLSISFIYHIRQR